MAINWITKSNHGNRLVGDVRMSIARADKRNKARTVFSFSNRWADTISKTGRILVGIDGSKIYFKDDENGYKISVNGGGSGEATRLTVSGDELLEIARTCGGDYKLNKDKINGLWFIETNVDSSFDKYK